VDAIMQPDVLPRETTGGRVEVHVAVRVEAALLGDLHPRQYREYLSAMQGSY
jgi:hypothetical protein